MTILSAIVIPLAILASYLSAVSLSLISYSPTAFDAHAQRRNRPEVGGWLRGQVERLLHATSLLRIAVGVAIFVMILGEIVGFGDGIALETTDLLKASGISVAIIWLSTTVFARAIARYIPVQLLWTSMPMLKLMAMTIGQATLLVRWVDEAVRRLTESPANSKEQDPEHKLLRQIQDTSIKAGLDDESREMLENVVEFRTTDVGAVMTPRTDIEGIEMTNDFDEIRAVFLRDRHSRIPVYNENLDNITGILYVKDLVEFIGKDAPDDFRLKDFLRKPLLVPETKAIHQLLSEFQRSEVHMAIVIDEYGGTAGLVTIEDLLEEIVGEIYDEHEPDDEEEPTLVQVDATRAEVDGRFHIDDLNDCLSLELPEDEEFDTVAGFVMSMLGRVPEVGEVLEADGARFTAIAATDKQIEKLRVELTGDANGSTNGQGSSDSSSNVARSADESS